MGRVRADPNITRLSLGRCRMPPLLQAARHTRQEHGPGGTPRPRPSRMRRGIKHAC